MHFKYSVKFIPVLLFCTLASISFSASSSPWSHALSMYGDFKYAKEFTHFEYVNSNAPKGGKFKQATIGSFDSLNPFVVKGNVAAGITMIYDSLLKQSSDEPERKRVLILLTSASQPTGKISPESAAQLAREAGLALHTIAIGATSYTAEEVRNSGLIYHPVDTELLGSLAERTGGSAYLARDTQTLEQAIAAIEKSESNIRKPPPNYLREPLYQWPLFFGLALMGLIQLVYLLRGRSQ